MDAYIIKAAAGVGAAVFGGYMVYEQFQVQVRELELIFPNLPPAFDGYSILHLSDLHLSKLGLLERRVMEIIGAREVDACMITGDVTAEPRACDNFRRLCSVIKHVDPIYITLGNSEHKPWLDTDTLVDALSFEGNRILVNDSATINRGGDRVVVVGVDDPHMRLDDLDGAFEEVDASDFIIFLTHSPSNTPSALALGADMVLSGHTHGGQVRIPALGMMWTHMRENKKLNDGLYSSSDLTRILGVDAGSSALFVNRGIGTSRLHIRFLCPPEIVYITLKRG